MVAEMKKIWARHRAGGDRKSQSQVATVKILTDLVNRTQMALQRFAADRSRAWQQGGGARCGGAGCGHRAHHCRPAGGRRCVAARHRRRPHRARHSDIMGCWCVVGDPGRARSQPNGLTGASPTPGSRRRSKTSNERRPNPPRIPPIGRRVPKPRFPSGVSPILYKLLPCVISVALPFIRRLANLLHAWRAGRFGTRTRQPSFRGVG
jgi:hypothetical protein